MSYFCRPQKTCRLSSATALWRNPCSGIKKSSWGDSHRNDKQINSPQEANRIEQLSSTSSSRFRIYLWRPLSAELNIEPDDKAEKCFLKAHAQCGAADWVRVGLELMGSNAITGTAHTLLLSIHSTLYTHFHFHTHKYALSVGDNATIFLTIETLSSPPQNEKIQNLIASVFIWGLHIFLKSVTVPSKYFTLPSSNTHSLFPSIQLS